MYGLFAALFVRGRYSLALGEIESVWGDWDLALRVLGRELALDFLESSSWHVRSADLLLNYPQRSAANSARKLVLAESWESPPKTPRAAVLPFRAVDPHCARWPCHITEIPAHSEVESMALQKPVMVAVYGYHPVLIEPVATLAFSKPQPLALDWRWYGVQDRDCSFFSSLCQGKRANALRSIAAEYRFRSYTS